MTRIVVVGGMPGWQTALIAVCAALLTATLAVLADRLRAAHVRVPAIQRCDDASQVPPGGVPEPDEYTRGGVTRDLLEETGIRGPAELLAGVFKRMRLG